MKRIVNQKLAGIARGDMHDPHSVLGMHLSESGYVVRVYLPDAVSAEVRSLDVPEKVYAMTSADTDGFYMAEFAADAPFRYQIHAEYADGSVWDFIDPYQFLPTISEDDLYLFNKGDHRMIFDKLGAHADEINGIKGVRFAVWAPTARRVSVVGDFNHWDGRHYLMRSLGSSGVWEIFIPGIEPGALYKFEIYTQSKSICLKTDPYGFYFQKRPENASVVFASDYKWHDAEYCKKQSLVNHAEKPMSIYEVHPGSWRRKEDENWLSYREMADELTEHVKTLGFTHIELLPVMEHPFDGSWGYQVTGYYAPSSRFGTPDDFRYFVDICHQKGIGVILDWVPAHFPKDDFALGRFDGSALYEHEDPRLGEHPDWGTYIFNYGRNEVKNFLLANAVYWLKEFHADGLRIDAVASMLYLDYSRKEGEWIPNKFGGRENLEAIEFLKHLNSVIAEYFPGALIIAEESTAWGGVTKPVSKDGMGFNYKWNMGWMNDFLRYMSKDPIYRKYHHNDLTFSMLYAYSESFILVLSHDEIVHGKRSLLSKMPGDDWQKFANFKAMLTFMYGHPGKKLLFMGTELAPWNEWNEERGLEWDLLQWNPHKEARLFLEHLNHLYVAEPALWEKDPSPDGFRWIDADNSNQSVVSFVRQGNNPGDDLIFICNFTPETYREYRVGVREAGEYKELFNSDAAIYGGSGVTVNGVHMAENTEWNGQSHSIRFGLPPLGVVIFKRIH